MSENTYAAAGVNIEEGDRAVELFAPLAKRATRPEVMGGLGGFAGLFKLGEYKEPILLLVPMAWALSWLLRRRWISTTPSALTS